LASFSLVHLSRAAIERQFSRQDDAIAIGDDRMTTAAMRTIMVDARRNLFIVSPLDVEHYVL
jgi:hypothetical protein